MSVLVVISNVPYVCLIALCYYVTISLTCYTQLIINIQTNILHSAFMVE